MVETCGVADPSEVVSLDASAAEREDTEGHDECDAAFERSGDL